MKIVKIALVSFFVLILVVIVAGIIFIKTFDVNRFKPQIVSLAGKTLNRQVDFQNAKLGLSLRHGVSLKIHNLVIADDPAFSKGNFLTVKDISLAVDVLKYCFKKEVDVPSILIDSPSVTVIRRKDGSLNVATIAQSAQGSKQTAQPDPPSAALALPAILISSVKGTNGSVTFIDQTFEPPLRIEISKLGFSSTDMSLTKPFPFAAEAEVVSPKMNINLEGKAQVNLSKIVLDKAVVSLGQGVIKATGAIDDYLVKQEYSLDAEAKNVAIQDLLSQVKLPVKAEGLASGNMKLKGRGFSPEALKSTLSGDGLVTITQLKLKDVNVLRRVLGKISLIPGLAEKVEAGLSGNFKQNLTGNDTSFSDINLPVTVENGRILVKNLTLAADEFTFNGSGEAGFDSAYSLEGTFLIPQELSASMATQVPELQYLFDNDKQISMPLEISGRAGTLSFSLDAKYIAEKLIVKQGEQQLFKALEKAIGIKEKTPSATGQSAP